FSRRRRHTRLVSDWSSDVCSSDLGGLQLFRDHRAWQIGDVVTVQIAQNATATKNAAENIGRTDSVKSTVNNLFGLPTSFGRSSEIGRASCRERGERTRESKSRRHS